MKEKSMSGYIYVACPYTHKDPKVRTERFEAVNKYCAVMMKKGYHLFSPISHTHPIALAGDLPVDWDFWEQYDRAMLEPARVVHVYCLPGWKESKGVRAEIRIAEEKGIHVEYIQPIS